KDTANKDGKDPNHQECRMKWCPALERPTAGPGHSARENDMTYTHDYTARARLFGGNRMKLGVMAFNCSHGSTITTVPEAWKLNWPDTKDIAQAVDRAGMEALLPVGRWKGYGGPSNFNNCTFESFTWASAIGAVTNYCTVLATVHVPLVHPLMVAKMAATIDHVTGGRFAMNVVCGWFKNEFDMFGAHMRPHDDRYKYATEWLDFVRRAWTQDEEFDFTSESFNAAAVWSQPERLRKPHPPIMNAGGSPAAQDFTTRYCDMNFVILKDRTHLEGAKAQIDHLKQMARAHGRETRIWIHVYVVCRESEKEAKDYLNYYVYEKGDWEAAGNLLKIFGMHNQPLDAKTLDGPKAHFIAGHGGYPLVGTAEQIVDELGKLADIGVDGCLISWVRYKEELAQWNEEVLPLMVQAGMGAPVPPAQTLRAAAMPSRRGGAWGAGRWVRGVPTMRRVAAALACFALLALMAASGESARADEPYPSKPIRLVLPQPAGGAVDLIARALGDRLSHALRQPVIVENQPGANGGLAAGQVARSTPDGYPLFMAVDTNLVVNPNLYPNLAYDPFRDFVPISIIAKVYLVLVASSKIEANSVGELLAFARAHPGKLNYASIGLGTQAHLGMELLKIMTKTDITQVSYRGTAPAMTDIAAGVVDVMFTGPPSAMALAAGGKGKMLAIAAPSRSSLMPQLPTMQEAGVPGYELSGWFGLLAPAKTPQHFIDRLASEVKTAV